MGWPDISSQDTPTLLHSAEMDIAAIANAIVDFEPVTVYCSPTNVHRANALVSPSVTIKPLPLTELWMRDTGPVFVQSANGSLVGLDMNFNYWGHKYRGPDGTVAEAILDKSGIERVRAPFVAEGGAIEVDGEGTLLLTESSVLNDNRNPGKTKKELEGYFSTFLGVEKVIWVRGAKGKDITDWHIDAMARFVTPGRVLLSRPPRSSPAWVIDVYEQAKFVLESEVDAKGRQLEVLTLEEADPSLVDDGNTDEMVLSYLNYLVVNGGLIIPSFGDDEADKRAFGLFEQLFPERKVVSVRLNALRNIGGGIHCATQQQPKV